jgi:hypothetical protein
MPAKKPPPVIADPSGVFVKLPVSAETAAALGEVFSLFSEIGQKLARAAELGATLEGKTTRALATRPRRPRARRR